MVSGLAIQHAVRNFPFILSRRAFLACLARRAVTTVQPAFLFLPAKSHVAQSPRNRVGGTDEPMGR